MIYMCSNIPAPSCRAGPARSDRRVDLLRHRQTCPFFLDGRGRQTTFEKDVVFGDGDFSYHDVAVTWF